MSIWLITNQIRVFQLVETDNRNLVQVFTGDDLAPIVWITVKSSEEALLAGETVKVIPFHFGFEGKGQEYFLLENEMVTRPITQKE